MSEYHFGVGRGRVPTSVKKRVDRIARKHGACFIAVTLPGDGPSYWFSGPNRGSTFDDAMARAVYEDIAAAGIELPLGAKVHP